MTRLTFLSFGKHLALLVNNKKPGRKREPNRFVIFALLQLPTTDSRFLQGREEDCCSPYQFWEKAHGGRGAFYGTHRDAAGSSIPWGTNFFFNFTLTRQKILCLTYTNWESTMFTIFGPGNGCRVLSETELQNRDQKMITILQDVGVKQMN